MRFSIKHLILTLPFLFLGSFVVQSTFHPVRVEPLGGVAAPQDTVLTVNGLLAGKYQTAKEDYWNENLGFRPWLVKWYNELNLLCFKKLNGSGIIRNQDGLLYTLDYQAAHYGADFQGEAVLDLLVNDLVELDNNLKARNKLLLVVSPCDKFSFAADGLPENVKMRQRTTNQQYLFDAFAKKGLHHINFRDYFIQQKTKSKYPLVPQFGAHWSAWGAYIALDSTIHYIEREKKINIPDITVKNVEMSNCVGKDCDLEQVANLWYKHKEYQLAYPHFSIKTQTGQTKPNVVVIADSYHRTLYDLKAMDSCFSQHSYQFYDQYMVENGNDLQIPSDKVNWAQKLAEADVVILMATSLNVKNIGWASLKKMNTIFKENPTLKHTKTLDHKALLAAQVKEKKEGMRKSESWTTELSQKAKSRNISLDSMMTLDALYMINNQ
jgi:SGNH hydrolase-like domain, acetyltransferase AlgX